MAIDGTDHFCDLDRTFHELSEYAHESDDVDLSHVFHVGERLHWSDLINDFRVVILSEAGSGKTAEIRNQANFLRSQGKPAFFLRLEHVVNDFEDAFEVGTFEEFTAWLDSNAEGWLLLDSIDEARLRNPSDFAQAIRVLGRRLYLSKDRAHIFLTGRTFAWRPKTDLDLCTIHLPFTPSAKVEIAHNSEVIFSEATTEQPDSDDDEEAVEKPTNKVPKTFKIVALDNLNTQQIETFAKARGVEDTRALLQAIERADASTFTARPQDLRDVVDFWVDKGRIGSRLELMQNNIQRRLFERDQDRADARPLSIDRIREGARTLAAATTLTKVQAIQVPDGAESSAGIAVGAVLSAWDQKDQQALLSRPIFDEAIYGTVRFHHRSVREYLAAEWFAKLLSRETSRRSIEGLFFRTQYGVNVVTPTLRPLLPWLAILDTKIRERLLIVAPEVLLEGGDPSQMDLETRKIILRDVCNKISNGRSGGSLADYSAVQRFASADLGEDVAGLLIHYSENA